MAKIFVTGATGLLGANLAVQLAHDNHELALLHRTSSYHPFLESLDFEKKIGDVEDLKSLIEGMKGCDCVIHSAGYVSYSKHDRDLLHRVNVNGTRNVMDAAVSTGVKKVIVTSSTAAIGIPPSGNDSLDETGIFEKRYRKIGYMWTKKQAEEIALSYRDRLHVVVLNPTTFFGAGDTKMNTGELIKNIFHRKIPFAPPGSNSVTSVRDVVEGHLLAMERGINGERYILAHEHLSHLELMNLIAEVLKVKKITKVIPSFMVPVVSAASFVSESLFGNRNFTPQVVLFSSKHRYFSSEKAQDQLGWKPKVPVARAITEAVEFYRTHDLL